MAHPTRHTPNQATPDPIPASEALAPALELPASPPSIPQPPRHAPPHQPHSPRAHGKHSKCVRPGSGVLRMPKLEEIILRTVETGESKYNLKNKDPDSTLRALYHRYRHRPFTANPVHRQRLLTSMTRALDYTMGSTRHSCYADRVELIHMGFELEAHTTAADYTPVPSGSNGDRGETDKDADYLRRYYRTAQRVKECRVASAPLSKYSKADREAEPYLLHLAKKRMADTEEAESMLQQMQDDDGQATESIFHGFQQFAERLRERALADGQQADVELLDEESTQRALFERYLHHHATAAKREAQDESPPRQSKARSPLHSARSPPHSARSPPGDFEEGTLTASLHRLHSFPKQGFRTSQLPRSDPALRMHTREKMRNLAKLIERQTAAQRCTAELERTRQELEQLEASLEAAQGEEAERLRERVSEGREKAAHLEETLESIVSVPSSDRRVPNLAPIEWSEQKCVQTQKRAQEELNCFMEAHSAGHFTSLQRQQARHQSRARLRFNKSPASIRRRVLELRQQRMDDDVSGRSACLLFMPPRETPLNHIPVL